MQAGPRGSAQGSPGAWGKGGIYSKVLHHPTAQPPRTLFPPTSVLEASFLPRLKQQPYARLAWSSPTPPHLPQQLRVAQGREKTHGTPSHERGSSIRANPAAQGSGHSAPAGTAPWGAGVQPLLSTLGSFQGTRLLSSREGGTLHKPAQLMFPIWKHSASKNSFVYSTPFINFPKRSEHQTLGSCHSLVRQLREHPPRSTQPSGKAAENNLSSLLF